MYDDGEPEAASGSTNPPSWALDPYSDISYPYIDTSDAPVPPASLPGGVETADQTYRTSPASGDVSFGRFVKDLMGAGGAQKLLGQGLNFATSKGGIAALAALLGMLDRQRASGGGTKMGMPAPRQYTRTVDPKGIVRYAANGGLMHAYAQGGEARAYAGGKPLMMEDGGFVFTQKATEELGPRGIAALGGKMISAPGNGTDDKGITGIIGKHGVTPARVSNKESYFPEEAVAANGGPKRMYAAMNNLQRKA